MRVSNMVSSCCLGRCLPVSHVTVLVVIIVVVYGVCGVALDKAARVMAALANLATAAQGVVQAALE